MASGPTDYISIAILSLYVIVVLVHVFSSMWHKRSFSCWDTIEELLLLAKASEPSPPPATKKTIAPNSPISQSSEETLRQADAGDTTTQPIEALANTSSGIQCLSTYGLRAYIRAVPNRFRAVAAGSSSPSIKTLAASHEEVQLVIGEAEAQSLDSVQPNRAYGRSG